MSSFSDREKKRAGRGVVSSIAGKSETEPSNLVSEAETEPSSMADKIETETSSTINQSKAGQSSLASKNETKQSGTSNKTKQGTTGTKGRPKSEREIKKRVSLAIMPSLYENIQKIAYVDRRSISEIVSLCLEQYTKENADKLMEYERIKK